MISASLLALLGDEIEDVDEETFHLFTTRSPLPDLGLLDPSTSTLTISLPSHADIHILQSPGQLNSSRATGTTGAAAWQTGLRTAAWIARCAASPTSASASVSASGSSFARELYAALFPGDAVVMELGSGSAGLVATVLAPRVREFWASDLEDVLPLLGRNLLANCTGAAHHQEPSAQQGKSNTKSKNKTRRNPKKSSEYSSSLCAAASQSQIDNISLLPLDWETTSIPALLTQHQHTPRASSYPLAPRPLTPDVLLATDCIYNTALISPFISTCKEICELRRREISAGTDSDGGGQSERKGDTVVLIAQQLRQAEVFESWLGAFVQAGFAVWRARGDLGEGEGKGGLGLGVESGFVVHVGVLR